VPARGRPKIENSGPCADSIGAQAETRIDHHLPTQPSGVDAFAQSRHHARSIRARLGRILQARVLAELDPEIAVVERRRLERDHHFTGRRGRRGQIGNAQLVQGNELDGFHPATLGRSHPRPQAAECILPPRPLPPEMTACCSSCTSPTASSPSSRLNQGSKWRTLADFGLPRGVYALGRLDADSEGLLLFSDERGLNSRLLDPKNAHRREYWAQVEGVPTADALARLARGGIAIDDYRTLPCRARVLDPQPVVAPRVPPIRIRKSIPDTWIALELTEGKNRQVRRMTAAVGHPTLRLVRVRTGKFRSAISLPGNGANSTPPSARRFSPRSGRSRLRA